jgi:DNA gyrase subunit B
VRFWPDRLIFTKDAHFDIASVHARVQQTTFLVPGLAITVVDDRPASAVRSNRPILDPQTDPDLEAEALEEVDGGAAPEEGIAVGGGTQGPVAEQVASSSDQAPHIRVFRHEGGITEFVEHLSSGNPVSPVLRLRGEGTFSETVPVLDDRGHMTPTEVERELVVDVALRWSDHYSSDLRSFVNIVATPKGGTHVTGFERAVVKTFNEYLRSAKILREKEDNVSKEDVLEGATAVVTVRLAEPQFEGQTKEILGTPAATKIVGAVISARLGEWLAEPPRGEKNTVRAVADKVANAMRARVAARAHRDVQRRKSALESSAMPAKLVDCRTSEVDRSELFIVEGNSALGTAKLARDSEFQALLPIRGKILNVHKASIADMLKNAECAAIITVIGAGSGRTFDLDSVRYSKIILMADADVDGAHIRTLLLTLFHRYMPELLAAGRVYSAVPPLHRIEILDNRGRVGEVRYTHSDEQMRATLADLTRRGKRWKDPVQRYKGLGEMDAGQLRETTMEPGRRTLRRVQVADAAVAAKVFDLLMGSEVAPRKEFIVAAGADLDRERIDA